MRILIVKLSSLGDLMHALPVVHAVRGGFDAEIHWATQAGYVDLVRTFPEVDRVLGFPRHGGPAELGRFVRELRREPYDLVLDLQGLQKSAWVSRLARGQRRVGPSYHREGSRLLYGEVAGPALPRRHAVEQALDTVRFLGLPAEPVRFPTAFPAPALEGVRPYIALVPCSRWPTKNWPPDRFKDVGNRLRETVGGTCFLVGGPDDRVVCADIAGAVPGLIDTGGRFGLPEMAGLLGAMDLVITVDTGPMHIAAAQGVPVLAVFGATDPDRTGPYGMGHQVLTASALACRPCLSRTCQRKDLACLDGVDAATVVARARQMLEAGTSR